MSSNQAPKNKMLYEEVANKPDVVVQELKDDGVFPNSKLPLLIYRNAVRLPETEPAEVFELLFRSHDWRGSWRNGIYPYHHYNSTAHEVLGVYRGSAKVQLGGEGGVTLEVAAGDVLVIPAESPIKILAQRPASVWLGLTRAARIGT